MREAKLRQHTWDRRFSYSVIKHQHKAEPFAKALRKAGVFQNNYGYGDVTLLDKDWASVVTKKMHPIGERQHNRGSVVVLYPHSAVLPWWYDGIFEPQEFVACLFVVAEGQKEGTKLFYNKRVETCGWPWSPQKDFSLPSGESVLFAPIHPSKKDLRVEAIEANASIQEELLKMNAKVTCRYIGELEHQGIEYTDKWIWVKGGPDGSYSDIDRADVVIAEGTFMYLSVARGKPTIGINQHLPMRSNARELDAERPHNWHKYGDDIAYPINYSEGNLKRLIDWATKEEQTEWRRRFIGKSLEPRQFTRTIIDIYKEETKRRGIQIKRSVPNRV